MTANTWNAATLLPILPQLRKRREISRFIRPFGIGVELGVAEGAFSETLLEESGLAHLYSIDMWAGDRGHDVEQYKRTVRRLTKYRDRNTILKLRFDEALDLFDDASLDFVYVDGYAHTGEEGGKTFHDWLPKVRPGGVLAGHDYLPNHHPKVVEAVQAFVTKARLPLYILDDRSNDEWNNWSPTWFTVLPL